MLRVLAGPLAATAQQPAGKLPHVGFLGRGDHPFIVTAFRESFRQRGYEEGRNFTITTRWDEGNDERRLTILAADLVRLKVDVIVTFTSQASLAAKAATTTIPVVVITGFVRDLALSSHHTRPASNLTGFTLADDGITGKQLQLLKEMVPTTM
jgi:putative ABC transport system substrate-binding protein